MSSIQHDWLPARTVHAAERNDVWPAFGFGIHGVPQDVYAAVWGQDAR
jgi:hypothetical protein